ncbi:glycosyltransferase family 4 protein [Pseudonocardia xishanensis]|uniref:Glycosyltransferase family 4 protein n=1 Tax=Pseudonocardia xishanensis TaxID=630995 RepID=A0ABP8S224_9PSEU
MAESRMSVLMAGPDPAGQGGMETAAELFLRHSGADVHYVSTYRAAGPVGRLRRWAAAWVEVLVALVSRRPDVVHVHLSERSSIFRDGAVLAFARVARVPSVLHCHGAEFEPSFLALPGPLRRLARGMLGTASAVLVLGDRWTRRYSELLDLPAQRFTMLYNPVELPTRPSVRARRGGTVRVLFLGRLGARKGVYDVVKACAALPEEIRARLELRIGGDGEVDAVRDLCRSELGTRATVLGWLDPAGKEKELAAADVFVLPSQDEGLPMALLEAMAWGLVPVVSTAGAMGEVVRDGENGLIVPAGDVDGIEAALRRVVGDDALRAELASAARRDAASFAVGPYMDSVRALWTAVAR